MTSPGPITISRTMEFSVGGMTCNNCVRHVTAAMQSVPGVQSATVILENQRATVRWLPTAKPDVATVIAAVAKAGFAARPLVKEKPDHPAARFSGWQLTLLIGVLGVLPLMLGEWIFHRAMTPWFQWLSLGLASVVQIFSGAQFYRGAWNQLKVGQSNMDTLVALGSTTAFGFSAWSLFSGQGGHVFFMESASIITLVSLGHWLEARVSRRAAGALRELLQLAPQTARRITPSRGSRREETHFNFQFSSESLLTSAATKEEEIPVVALQIGDLIALRPGDQVPTDGEVVAGQSAVNEAMLTGESVPVEKTGASKLFAGTVNLNSRLVMRVTAIGEETALAHIIAAVQRAQTSRADIQRIGDRVSNVFVPVVVGIAMLAALWWGGLPESAHQVHAWLAQFLPWPALVPDQPLAAACIIAASVLIIACPCAMGLATPAAIMAAANAAARQGILIRDGVALEKAGEVTAVIFDKTGTLTTGRTEVAAVGAPVSDPACFETANLRAGSETGAPSALAAALARHSAHPVSQAIAKLSNQEMAVTDWQEISGGGVEGNIQHSTFNIQHLMPRARLGSLRWLKEMNVELSAGNQFVAEWSGQGATLVGLAVEKNLLALFAVKDTLKPGAAQVIEQLQRQGLKTFIVTGDNPLTAASLALQLGIPAENVFAGVRPEQKSEFIKKLQAQGERVAFVGDGINDAPALEQADLGIAVSRASDVARAAADILLLKSEIEAVPECLELARATLRTIKQNLFWAFFYNALGIPLAALGFMSPILCAAAMGCSDLIVIGNALRLARRRSGEIRGPLR